MKRTSKTQRALKENTKRLTSTSTKRSKSTTTSSTPQRKSTTKVSAKAKNSDDPKYTRSRNDDLFPTYRIFPWRLEPRNGTNMNLAWFQCYEHAKQHIKQYRITKYKLLAHTSLPIDCTPDHRAYVSG